MKSMVIILEAFRFSCISHSPTHYIFLHNFVAPCPSQAQTPADPTWCAEFRHRATGEQWHQSKSSISKCRRHTFSAHASHSSSLSPFRCGIIASRYRKLCRDTDRPTGQHTWAPNSYRCDRGRGRDRLSPQILRYQFLRDSFPRFN